MDRRGFFGRLAAVVLAGLARPWWARYQPGDVFTIEGTYAVNPPPLAFHPKAFEMTMEPLEGPAVTGAGHDVFITKGDRGYVFHLSEEAIRELEESWRS